MTERKLVNEYLKNRVAKIEGEVKLPEMTVFKISECFHSDYSLIVKNETILNAEFQTLSI